MDFKTPKNNIDLLKLKRKDDVENYLNNLKNKKDIIDKQKMVHKQNGIFLNKFNKVLNNCFSYDEFNFIVKEYMTIKNNFNKEDILLMIASLEFKITIYQLEKELNEIQEQVYEWMCEFRDVLFKDYNK